MARQKTARQRVVIAELRRQGTTVYDEAQQGKSIVAAFRRYLTTGESRHISKGLYHYLTMKAGFIAHFNVHEFRRLYADPADLLAARHEFEPIRPHGLNESVYVYADGMTSLELWRQLAGLIREHRDEVIARSQQTNRRRELAAAAELASRHGMRLTATPERSGAGPGADPGAAC
jgi:hypothetical protein